MIQHHTSAIKKSSDKFINFHECDLASCGSLPKKKKKLLFVVRRMKESHNSATDTRDLINNKRERKKNL